MRRAFHSFLHAVSLFRHLGVRRFFIALACWSIQRYRPVVQLLFRCFALTANCDGASRDPVLIYQMSKVGSTSLFYSLQFAYLKLGLPDVQLHHVHALANIDLQERTLMQCCGREQDLACLQKYRQIRSHLDTSADERWTAISLVRDPVARHISAYFHHLDTYLPDWEERWRCGAMSVERVIQNFLSAADYADQWFDVELKAMFGIDVFSRAFPHAAGYRIFEEEPKLKLMIVRLEDLNRVAARAVEELLGISNFQLYSFNSTDHCARAELYQRFKMNPLPEWYLERAYSSRLARHFYTEEERRCFARKWSQGAEKPVQLAPPAPLALQLPA